MSVEKVALGRALFFDRRLSRDGSVSCAVCHDPARAFSDSNVIAEGVGAKQGTRNSPTLLNSISDNTVDSATYVGLAMSYAIPWNDRDIEVFGVINNLFDKDPPIAPGGGDGRGSNYPTNPVFFDTLGATFRFGLRARF